ncbi:ALB32 protein [Gonium pectorale]|uniref:ALB32 protein n=1 Tax=Gonium pectorale TaxID=33097 RepID=A0A150G525_GONPE|nr:ALB32 protein [Gonium pectorale]|eukprot:KXZ44976.1 ALB32 protein [Gonium pectorale]
MAALSMKQSISCVSVHWKPGFGSASRRSAVVVKAVLEPSTAASAVEAVHHAQALYTLADGGPIDLLANFFEAVLRTLDDGLEKAHVPYSYGFSIIALTVLVKLATFPLTQKQVESTLSLQALQPRVKELQAKYADDPENLQLETARLYKEAGVNPLAGCLPTLATIPVFIGLYNALSNAAKAGLLTEGFFWIPSLGGPTTIGGGLEWLFPLQDGAPPVGWANAGAYLVMPVLLVASQYISQKIISTQQQNTDPSQQQAQAILKFLPLMIGWFSLNVPSGLTLYWFINNLLSTGQQLYLKATVKVNIPEAIKAPVASTSNMPVVKPKEERVKKVTGKELGSRKKRRNDDGDEIEDVEVEVVSTSGSNGNGSANGGSGRKGEKFRALRAREAAAKAASVAEPVRAQVGASSQDGASENGNGSGSA